MNRREFTRVMVGGALGAGSLNDLALRAFAGSHPSESPLTRAGSFMVQGKPVFLVSGSIDYFRCPPELWRDRLLKAKRAGLNCIASCIAWNFHESEEGQFNFSGDRDLGRFIDICGELGLYFFARFGPFICDEWEGGGHPAWLIGKDAHFRAMHEPTLRYLRRWVDHLMPILVGRQITRGGPVILVQQENEYYFSNRPDGRDYQTTLVRWMRESGIEVTITDCNGYDARVPGSHQTLNAFDTGERYRQDRPDLPVLVSEHYTDYLDCWGWPYTAYPAPDQVEQQSMRMLAARVMYNYFMYYGGTNFGFWAGNSWKTDHSFVTTNYYPKGPLAEGGAFNEMFYVAKACDQLAANFQEFFCQSRMVESPIKAEGPVVVSALQSSKGTMLFVRPAQATEVSQNFRCDGQMPIRWSDEHRPSIEIREQPGVLLLPSGEKQELAEGSAHPIMAPFGYRVLSGCRIDWANATLLGITGSHEKPTLVFRGNAARKGLISINGQRVDFGFGKEDPSVKELGTARILGLSRELANRAWFVDGRLFIGPVYVGERVGKKHECWLDDHETIVHVVESNEDHRQRRVSPTPALSHAVPLKQWCSCPLPEIQRGGKGWRAIEGPQSLEQLEAFYGYAWYRASYHAVQALSTQLQFTIAADRFHVYLNGKPCGVWGRGAKATRDPLPIELSAGENDFVFLCDNMGRSSEGRANERKGILGPVVLGAQLRELGSVERFSPKAPPSDNYEFSTYRAFNGSGLAGWARQGDNGSGLVGLAWTVKRSPKERFLLGLRWVPQYAWVLVDGKLVGEHGGDLSLVNGFAFKEFLLPTDDAKETIRIELVLYNGDMVTPEDHVKLYSFPDGSELTHWRFKSWETPRVEGKTGGGSPVWWQCELAKPKLPGPLFLHPEGLSKGQVWLNGRAAGRYWDIGPQKTLYLPEPWWKDRNHLAILDEEGRNPKDTFVARDARVPTSKAVL
jgi:hypothetical protein